MKYKVASSQYSYKFGEQLHMPYTIAILISYLLTDDTIKETFEFLPTAVERTDIDNYIYRCGKIDVLLCSCYSWNWEISKELAKKTKNNNPNCLIVFGGPRVPADINKFFDKYNFIDLVVQGEGESALKNIFINYVNNKGYSKIEGVSTKSCISKSKGTSVRNINDIPSPYINGLMEKLIDINRYKWIPTWETMRGCPYNCSYCAWGVSSYNKVRKYNIDRLYEEIDWFSNRKLEYIECADSNFGMFDKDVLLAKYLKKVKLDSGYPITFKPSWDKSVSTRLEKIATELKSANLLASLGCSLQSLNEDTLDTVNRKSLDFRKFNDFIGKFNKMGVQCFTEIIRGMPGETLDSFKEGLNKVIYNSTVDTVYIYNCSVLENTEMNTKEYREKYNIETTRMPLYFAHAVVDKSDIVEYEEIIVSCNSFSKKDIKEMSLYSWFLLTFQKLGIFDYITKYLLKNYEVSYEDLYCRFIELCKGNNDIIIKDELKLVEKYIKNAYEGNGWNHIDHKLGPIVWPIDEASWLRLTCNRKLLRESLLLYIEYIIGSDADSVIHDLLDFQLYTLIDRSQQSKYVHKSFIVDWIKYFNTGELVLRDTFYYYKNKILINDNDYEWNKNAIWYGRRKINYKIRLNEILYDNRRMVVE